MWGDIPQGGMNFNLKKRELRHRVALEKAQGTAPSAGVGRFLLLSATKLEAGGRLVGGAHALLGLGQLSQAQAADLVPIPVSSNKRECAAPI